jgi:hypothetical protein
MRKTGGWGDVGIASGLSDTYCGYGSFAFGHTDSGLPPLSIIADADRIRGPG